MIHGHPHHFNVHFLPRLIKGMDSYFPTAYDRQLPSAFSHHKAVDGNVGVIL